MDQGIDSEFLNVTATQFQGVKNAAQMRKEVIARLSAEGCVKQIFLKIIDNAIKFQNDKIQLKVVGDLMEIDPSKWEHKADCHIDVGIGSGDRQERIIGLNAILNLQTQMIETGSPLADDVKRYNTLEKLITEVGLKEVRHYFNDIEQPDDVLQAQVEQLKQALGIMQQQIANPLADAEKVRAQGKLAEQAQQQQFDMKQFIAKLVQDDKQFAANMLKDLTELELQYGEDVPGSAV
jgi:DNA polymerase III gamma/tau subunit